MFGRWIICGFAIALLIGAPRLDAQLPRPLIPLPDEGLRVAPFFDGWYANPDGTITLSFGYSNLNRELVEIPLGPNNFIVPKEHDGRQPTSFPIVVPESPGGGGGAAANRARARDRDRGVFTITVPAGHKGDVVWTLRYAGQSFSVPARAKSTAYQLSWPAAMGSVPPLLRFQPSGAAGRGPMGIHAAPLQGKVGTPLTLTVWLTDDGVHEKEPIKFGRERPGMNVSWYKHSGPDAIVFDPPKSPFPTPTGQSTTTVTFAEPGEYVIRVKADAFGYSDSSAGNQCCWTNGYQKVSVIR